MNPGPLNDPLQDKRWEENDAMDDPLWRLLGRAPRPEPDGWFTARTVARCRNEAAAEETDGVSVARFARTWRWVLGGGVALSVAMAVMVNQVQTERADKQKNVQEAFEIMASIDTDSDTSSSSPSWQDSSL